MEQYAPPAEELEEEGGEEEMDDSKNWACTICDKEYKTPRSLSTHMMRHHSVQKELAHLNASGRLQCYACNQRVTTYENLVEHLQQCHGFIPQLIKTSFGSRDEFDDWITLLSDQCCIFVRKRGEKTTADGSMNGDYYCANDGKKRACPSTRAAGKPEQNRRQMSAKLGFPCPAYLRYIIDPHSGVVDVRGQLSHAGHEFLAKNTQRPRRRLRPPPEGMQLRRPSRGRAISTIPSRIDLLLRVDLMTSRLKSASAIAGADLALLECGHVNQSVTDRIPELIYEYDRLAEAAERIELILREMKDESEGEEKAEEEGRIIGEDEVEAIEHEEVVGEELYEEEVQVEDVLDPKDEKIIQCEPRLIAHRKGVHLEEPEEEDEDDKGILIGRRTGPIRPSVIV